MNETVPSRTALVTALMRSLHSRADPEPLFDDPWGERLVPPKVREAIAARLGLEPCATGREAHIDAFLRELPAYANVVLRCRRTEDALQRAAAAGVGQTVLVGAGFDSFALRRGPALAQLAVFEIDHPATQGLKRQRLADCGVAQPEATHFIAADLGAEGLESALRRSPFDFGRPAFFSWLGVTMYLPRAANFATLAAIARCGAPGSELVFTYVDQRAFDAGAASAGFEALRASVAAVGEPMITGFEPAALARELEALGFELVEDLDGTQLSRRYAGSGANRLESSPLSRLAHLRLPARG
ncbi:MAG: SAM-dependent methyltransferase [Burkholderiales bacterium]|nr:SAM-dependent methyltransferase [Burkholderiales bacterium]